MNSNYQQMLLGTGVTAATHPITFTKILIQLGYEPLAPVQTTSILGRKVLCYPNIFKYIGHIKEKDGFLGLYRGLGARLFGSVVLNVVTGQAACQLKDYALPKADELDGVEETTLNQFKQLCRETSVETVSRCCGVIVSHPFHVVMVRSMAQFIGREEEYGNVVSGILEIPTKEGFLGYFSGLLPRLLGEVITIWLANILSFLANKYLVVIALPTDKETQKSYTSAVCTMAVTQLTYPFQLISNIMAVNNCGLIGGEPPVMPVYTGWMDCWKGLSAGKQLKRGSSMFWRHYPGPTITAAGAMRPSFN